MTWMRSPGQRSSAAWTRDRPYPRPRAGAVTASQRMWCGREEGRPTHDHDTGADALFGTPGVENFEIGADVSRVESLKR